jgi:hypothetical protein
MLTLGLAEAIGFSLQRPQLVDHFRGRPGVSPPDFYHASVGADERGGQAVGNRAALRLHKDGEALGQFVDFSGLTGGERTGLSKIKRIRVLLLPFSRTRTSADKAIPIKRIRT